MIHQNKIMITRKTLESMGFIFNHEAIKGGENFNYTHPKFGKISAHLQNGYLNINCSNGIINENINDISDLNKWMNN